MAPGSESPNEKSGSSQLGEIIVYGLLLGALLTALAFLLDPKKK